MRSRVLGILAVTTAFCLTTTGAGAVTARERAHSAAGFLVGRQSDDGSFAGSVSPVGGTADAVAALVGARRGPKAIDAAIGWLRGQVGDGDVETIGLKAKVAMAAVAAGRNPRRFGGANLVHQIRTTLEPDGRYGATTAVFDHALAVLALSAAGAPVAPESTAWLANAQCDDGGWQFDEPAGEEDDEHCWDGSDTDFFQSDTNTTSLALQALESAPGAILPPTSPFNFFRAARDDVKRGWGYDLTFTLTDANSTALVLQAYAAAGRDAPPGGSRALEDLQYTRCGNRSGALAFTWIDPEGDGTYKRSGPDTFATTGGILGLLEMPLPVPAHDVTRPATVCRRL